MHIVSQGFARYGTTELSLNIEDLESIDVENITKILDNYLKNMCPAFEPEIIYALDKEYFLPALKVLKYENGKFLSPGFDTEWVNGELQATCKAKSPYLASPKYVMLPNGTYELQFEAVHENPTHDAPNDTCDCGIYGSVNLDEIKEYLRKDYTSRYVLGDWGEEVSRKLCIVEPSPDANVIMCRKGWKASHVFISEVVGQTISQSEASQLLSIAWKREIDIRRLEYENR